MGDSMKRRHNLRTMSLDQHPFLAPLSRKARRFFGSWWRRQSPARQDRYATIGPLVAVLLFLAAIVLAFWYLRVEEMLRPDGNRRRADCRIKHRLQLRRGHAQRISFFDPPPPGGG